MKRSCQTSINKALEINKSFKNVIHHTLIKEDGAGDGYVNDHDDRGGETMHGITVKRAREYGYMGEMRDMPMSVVYNIYMSMYWTPIMGNSLDEIAPRIAKEVMDTAVLTGTYRSGIFLQRSLNALNNQQKIYKDIKVDGKIGKKTIKALKLYVAYRGYEGVQVLYGLLNGLLASFLTRLAERRELNEKFFYGWVLNRVLK